MRWRWVVGCFAGACGRIGIDPISDAGPEPAGVFERLAIPTGGRVDRIEVSPADSRTIFITVTGRLFRSIDRGASWRDCKIDSFARAIALGPTDANVIYTSDDGGLQRSSDGCATWT